MIVNAKNLDAFFQSLDRRYQGGLGRAMPWWASVAMEIPSNTEANVHGWMETVPKLREWIGERQYNNLKTRSQIVVNKRYEGSIEVPRTKIEDDQFGLYGTAAEELGYQAAKWPDDLILDRMVNGHDSTNPDSICFDGQAYFSASHPNPTDSGTFSNYLTGAPMAFSASAYLTARAAMAKFVDASGRQLGLIPDTLIVPADLEIPAKQLFNTAFFTPNAAVGVAGTSGASENVFQGLARVIVVPELTVQDTYYLLCTSRPIRGMVFQQREAPALERRFDPTSESVWARDVYQFGVKARGAGTYSLPQLAIKVKGS